MQLGAHVKAHCQLSALRPLPPFAGGHLPPRCRAARRHRGAAHIRQRSIRRDGRRQGAGRRPVPAHRLWH